MDIAQYGFRTALGGYERGKLFFRNEDAAREFAEKWNHDFPDDEDPYTHLVTARVPPGTPTEDVDLPAEGPATLVLAPGLSSVEPGEAIPLSGGTALEPGAEP